MTEFFGGMLVTVWAVALLVVARATTIEIDDAWEYWTLLSIAAIVGGISAWLLF